MNSTGADARKYLAVFVAIKLFTLFILYRQKQICTTKRNWALFLVFIKKLIIKSVILCIIVYLSENLKGLKNGFYLKSILTKMINIYPTFFVEQFDYFDIKECLYVFYRNNLHMTIYM